MFGNGSKAGKRMVKACNLESDKFGFRVYGRLSKLLKVYEPQPQDRNDNTPLTTQLWGLNEIKQVR